MSATTVSPNINTDRLMALATAEATRDHLLQNWDVADEWTGKSYASNGSPCFMVRADGGSGYEVDLGVRSYHALRRGGRMGALDYLNHIVVRSGGRPAAIPGAKVATLKEKTRIAALNVLALLGVIR